MKLLLLMPYAYDCAPCQRYRWEQWEPYLKAGGADITRLHFMTPALAAHLKARRWWVIALLVWRYMCVLFTVLHSARRYDAVIVHRNAALAGPPIIEAFLFALRCRVIYDFDDAIYMAPPYWDSWSRRLLRCDWRVAYICRRAQAVGVGNDFLAAFARKHNEMVFIWRTSIDMARYSAKSVEQSLPVVGWTGSPSTSVYINSRLPELAQLQKEVDFYLLIVGAQLDLSAYGIRGACVDWSSESEVATIQRMDIGLMPLDDTPWESGKCSLKSLQYQAAGLPAVVSAVGMNPVAVKDGETGFLVPPGESFAEPIRCLLKDSDLRLRMGRAARGHVAGAFSAEKVASKILQDLKAL